MRIVVAHSEDPDAPSALEDIFEQADAQLADDVPAGALLYAAVDLDHQALLDGIQARWPGLPLVGCTTDGEGSSCGSFAEDSMVLTLLVGNDIQVEAVAGRDLAADLNAAAFAAHRGLADALGQPPTLMVAVAESMGVSGASVAEALDRHAHSATLVVGGTAGDQWRFERTHQFLGREVLTDAVVALGVTGLKVSTGVQSGWTPMGPRLVVTRAEGNVLYELDGRPAIEVFHRFFGEHTRPSPEHPFAVFEGDAERFYLRAPFPTVRQDGSLLLAADIPEGATVQVTEAGREQILDGARKAMSEALAAYPGDDPQGVLFFSCAARKQVLGTRTAAEIGVLLEAAGRPLGMSGFYTYGEIGPLRHGGPSRFHNETVVAAVVGS